MNLHHGINEISEKQCDEIEESFEEILLGNVNSKSEETIEVETLCENCFNPLDVDESQHEAYCDKCQTVVFVHVRNIVLNKY